MKTDKPNMLPDMFNETSTIVQIWVNLIRNENNSVEDIPQLFNLQEIVKKALTQQ